MIDSILLDSVRRGSEIALCRLIDKYTAFVCTIIRNTTKGSLEREDVEEVASDVFFALWNNAHSINKLKTWLGATARNKAINKLRETRSELPLDEDVLSHSDSDKSFMENTFIRNFEHGEVRETVFAMSDPDREIFIRHYYKSQSVSVIAAETGMSESMVKQRLVRGRKKMGMLLEKGVLKNEIRVY